MARQRYMIGTSGPYFYDDAETYIAEPGTTWDGVPQSPLVNEDGISILDEGHLYRDALELRELAQGGTSTPTRLGTIIYGMTVYATTQFAYRTGEVTVQITASSGDPVILAAMQAAITAAEAHNTALVGYLSDTDLDGRVDGHWAEIRTESDAIKVDLDLAEAQLVLLEAVGPEAGLRSAFDNTKEQFNHVARATIGILDPITLGEFVVRGQNTVQILWDTITATGETIDAGLKQAVDDSLTDLATYEATLTSDMSAVPFGAIQLADLERTLGNIDAATCLYVSNVRALNAEITRIRGLVTAEEREELTLAYNNVQFHASEMLSEVLQLSTEELDALIELLLFETEQLFNYYQMW